MKHAFTSTKPPVADPTKVGSREWDQPHIIVGRAVSANFTCTADDDLILATGGSAGISCTPLPSAPDGTVFIVMKFDAGAGGVTILGTINGQTNFVLTDRWQFVELLAYSGTWLIVRGGVVAAAGSLAGAVLLAPTADQTILGARQLILNDPASGLWVASAASLGGIAIGDSRPGNNGSLGIDLTISDTWRGAVSANQFYGTWMFLQYQPDVAQAASIWGILNNLNSANDANTNGTGLVGYESHVIANSPGAIGSVQAAIYSAGVGASGGSPTFIFGLQVHAINSGTGTSPTNQAIKVTATGAGSAASIVTDNRSIEIDSPVVTGTLTHNYGIYIQDQGLGGAHNPDPHSIFIEGSAPNDLGDGVTAAGKLKLKQPLPVFANNAAAVSGGLTAGMLYTNGADPAPVFVVIGS